MEISLIKADQLCKFLNILDILKPKLDHTPGRQQGILSRAAGIYTYPYSVCSFPFILER